MLRFGFLKIKLNACGRKLSFPFSGNVQTKGSRTLDPYFETFEQNIKNKSKPEMISDSNKKNFTSFWLMKTTGNNLIERDRLMVGRSFFYFRVFVFNFLFSSSAIFELKSHLLFSFSLLFFCLFNFLVCFIPSSGYRS